LLSTLLPTIPGDTLIHCCQQVHMDFGFIQIIKYNA